ncbi:MAG: DASS family sodium-coupled anion symporter [Limosilactobacillus gorillae]|jgi:divalent anion:Na+ symporter, DASS family|uniref:DASS family sodium-coupled anion symporter n=1 Tax=Limosilactobacillus gorillae TaxID=1450649 RepID=UPI000A8FDC35|nr:DASS family sodium-coupled anion symporter [Limosilactobacillus gorillae]MDO4855827.1 DASS family sodium-coupled anion symporter [Limosilactobacillus gorillae]
MKTLEKVNYRGFIAPVVIGVILYLIPLFWVPAGLSVQAWQTFAIFVATIVGCITKPLPIAGTTLVGLIVMVLVGLAPVEDVENAQGVVTNSGILSAFSNSSSWLIAMAFIMAAGIMKTGLGNRIAYNMIKWFGKRSLGIAYALTGLELILGGLIPSNSARTGGVVWPLVESISTNYDSKPNDPSRKKIGSFLDFSAFHANIISTALFVTGAAPNIVVQQMAAKEHYNITWVSWFLAALVPVIISAVVVPFLIYKMYGPEVKETPNAREWSQKQLDTMGKMTVPEIIMGLTFSGAIIMWVMSSFIKLPQFKASFVAFLAVGVLLVTGVLTVKDVLSETGAWNILIWLSVLVFMAGKLTSYGFIKWFAGLVESGLHGISWWIVLLVLVLVMFYSHYFFASGTAHVTALYLPFLSVAVATGAPLGLSAMLLAFTTTIMASTTHYANGPASVLASTGYVTQSEWWKYNFILGLVYLVIFGVSTPIWLKVIGMY